MALKSKFALPLLMALLAAPAAGAQEAYWRVENPLPGQAPPAYSGEASPFPIKVRPPSQQEQVVEEVAQQPDPDTIRRQQQALAAASLLSEIREILRNNTAFREDLSGINISAISRTREESLVLIRNEWRTVGDSMTVPVVAAQKVNGLMDELKGIDPNLAQIVEEEMGRRLSAQGSSKLVIKQIKDDGIVLRNQQGRQFVISFQPSDF